MAKKLNDKELAKEDIVSRPEVTAGVADEAVKKPLNNAEKPASEAVAAVTEADEQGADRKARIFARRLGKALKSMTGDDVTDDEKEEISEIGGMIFRGLLRIPFGKALGGVIVAVCVAMPFLPRILKSTQKKEEKKDAVAG